MITLRIHTYSTLSTTLVQYNFIINKYKAHRAVGKWNYFLRKTERKFCAVLIAVSYELVINTS